MPLRLSRILLIAPLMCLGVVPTSLLAAASVGSPAHATRQDPPSRRKAMPARGRHRLSAASRFDGRVVEAALGRGGGGGRPSRPDAGSSARHGDDQPGPPSLRGTTAAAHPARLLRIRC